MMGYNRMGIFIDYQFIFLFSFVLYFFAPEHYSFTYCFIYFIIYISTAKRFLEIVIINKNWINFHFIFILVTFIVVFVYPIIIQPIDPTILWYFVDFPIKEKYICKGTALNVIAMLSYFIGSLYYAFKHNIKNYNYITVDLKINKHLLRLVNISICIVALLSCFSMFKSIGEAYDGDTDFRANFLFVTTTAVWFVINNNNINQRSLSSFLRRNRLILFCIVLFSIASLAFGSRNIVISLSLIVFCSYTFYYKTIRTKKLFLLAGIGFILMSFIGFRRIAMKVSKDIDYTQFVQIINTDNILSGLTLLDDFIVNTRNIYIGLEYTDTYGYQYGKELFLVQLLPIPFVPTALCNVLLNETPDDISSQRLLTKFTEKQTGNKIDFLLGTNDVVSVYMNFGLIGVILAFFGFGYIIELLHIIKFTNIFAQLFYFIYISSSVFIVRSDLIGNNFRACVWGGFILLLIMNANKRLNSEQSQIDNPL